MLSYPKKDENRRSTFSSYFYLRTQHKASNGCFYGLEQCTLVYSHTL